MVVGDDHRRAEAHTEQSDGLFELFINAKSTAETLWRIHQESGSCNLCAELQNLNRRAT